MSGAESETDLVGSGVDGLTAAIENDAAVIVLERGSVLGGSSCPSSTGNVGLLTDDWGRVTDWNEQPIEGLYAVGSVCALVG
jgi:hypothetical protein